MLARALSLALVLGLVTPELAAKEIRFARSPHVSSEGRLAFSFHGDIWVTHQDGTSPRRLTAHIARDTTPRFSPDGAWIAFNSNRMGNNDVWVVPSDGGEPRRLTFHSTDDRVLYWTPDGTGILIATSRGSHPWGSPLYVVPLDGGRPEPLDMDRGASGMLRQDGKMIAFNRVGMRYWRKHYRGNYNTDVWVQDLQTLSLRQLTDLEPKAYRSHTQDAHPMWGVDGMIYFMSERDGLYNIWKIPPRGGDAVQVTRHKEDGIQNPSISPDGRTIAYECGFQVWRLQVPDGTPQAVPINMAFDPKENNLTYHRSDSELDRFTVNPDGTEAAVEFHGEIFIVPVDSETGEKRRVTSSPWRDRSPSWSPDGQWIAYLSDRSLEEEIWIYSVEQETHRKLTNQESTKRGWLWSPDSSQIAFVGNNTLYLSEIESGETREIASNEDGGYSLVDFREGGRYLTYSRRDPSLNSEVYLFDLEESKEYNLTQHLALDDGGLLTPDGSEVVFASNRDNGTLHLWATPLTRVLEDPDDPLVKKKNKQAKKAKKEEGKEGDDSSDETDEPAPRLSMDLEDIDRRARQLTRGENGLRSYFLSPDGKTVYFVRDGALNSVPVRGGDSKKITDGSFRGLTPTEDGKSVFYSDSAGLWKLSLGSKKKTKVTFSLEVAVDRAKEHEQIFEEAWRVMKYRFYDENMHGFDWDAIKARYKPLLAHVGENQDLYDLCNEMIGELNASHTGVSGPPTRTMESVDRTRHLGFELESGDKRYRVSHIYRDGPADKEWIDLQVGDFLLEIEGREIFSGDNYYPLLNHLLNDYVTLKISRPAKEGEEQEEARTLRLRPVSSVRNLKYEEWVHHNRELVDRLSKGKIGYVHIRSMSRGPLRRFENEINQYWDKNGMIIDIRYNGGGNIDQELIDILERRPYEYWNSRRGGRTWGRRPRQCIAGPKVMLINARSGSDSEVTPQGFRDLELGRIVGTATYGAVIATGSYRLINGARIRTPGSLVTTYDPTKPHNYGINLENYGVPPDVWVENSPEDEIAGRDPELETAVKEALRMLAEGTWQYGEDD